MRRVALGPCNKNKRWKQSCLSLQPSDVALQHGSAKSFRCADTWCQSSIQIKEGSVTDLIADPISLLATLDGHISDLICFTNLVDTASITIHDITFTETRYPTMNLLSLSCIPATLVIGSRLLFKSSTWSNYWASNDTMLSPNKKGKLRAEGAQRSVSSWAGRTSCVGTHLRIPVVHSDQSWAEHKP